MGYRFAILQSEPFQNLFSFSIFRLDYEVSMRINAVIHDADTFAISLNSTLGKC